jgi:cyclophilin family peptidyl-prolyl cis-trans isomerase
MHAYTIARALGALGLVFCATATATAAAPASAGPPGDDPQIRRILDLEDTRPPGGGELVALSRAPEPEPVRVRAVLALSRLTDPAVAPALFAALESDASPAVQAGAAFGLGLIEGVDTARLQRALVAKRAPAAVLSALGRQGGPADVAVLVEALSGPHARAAWVALGLLARRQEGRLEGLPDHLLTTGPGAEDAFGVAYLLMRATRWEEGRVLPTARRLLAHAEPEVRAMACRALAGRPGANPDLHLRAAQDKDPRVRVEAIRALARSKAAATLTARLEVLAGALVAPEALAGPDLHPWLETLEAALGLPDTPALGAAAEKIHEASGAPVAADRSPGEALGLSHLRCRAAALLDRAHGELRHLPTCASPELPALVRETLTVPVLARLPEAGREAAVDAFLAAASPAGRAAFYAAVDPDSPSAWRVRVRAALDAADPAELAEAAGAAARLSLKDAGPPLTAALRRVLAAGDVETALSLLEAVAALKVAESAPAVLEAARGDQPALRKAALAAAKALGLTPEVAASPARSPAPLPDTPLPTRARVQTSKGTLVIALRGDATPRTVANFAALARRGFYDGQRFHRVVPDFVAQGGDPRGDGWGGPGYTIRCEIDAAPYVRGTVGMALAGKDTGGSQFFVTHTAHPHLDGGYTVFGRLESGYEALDALTVGDRIESVTVE